MNDINGLFDKNIKNNSLEKKTLNNNPKIIEEKTNLENNDKSNVIDLENEENSNKVNNEEKETNDLEKNPLIKNPKIKTSQLDKKKLNKLLNMNEEESIKLTDQTNDLIKNKLKLENQLKSKTEKLVKIGEMEKELEKEINQSLEEHFVIVEGYGEIPDRSQKTKDKLIETSYGDRKRHLKKHREAIELEISKIKNSLEENTKELEECSKI